MTDDVRSRIVREKLDENEPAEHDEDWSSADDRDTTSHDIYSYECPCGYTGPKSLDEHLEDDHGPEVFGL